MEDICLFGQMFELAKPPHEERDRIQNQPTTDCYLPIELKDFIVLQALSGTRRSYINIHEDGDGGADSTQTDTLFTFTPSSHLQLFLLLGLIV